MSTIKKKFSLDKLKKTDSLVIRTGREKNIDRVIFPNPVEVGLDTDALRSALTTHGGLKIPSGKPSETANVLYNESGVLKFNGREVFTDNSGIIHLTRLGVTGSIDIKGPMRVTGGIVTDDAGSEYIRAGDRIQVQKNSDGSFTISADVQSGTGTGGTSDPQYLTLAASNDLNNERVFTAGTGISVSDGGAGGQFTVGVDTSKVPQLDSANTFSSDITVQGSIKGSVQKLSDGSTDFIQAGSNVTVTNNVDGSISIASTDTNTDTTYTAGNGLSLSGTSFSVNLQPGGGLQITSSELSVNTSHLRSNGSGLKSTNSDSQLAVEPSDFAGSGLEDDGSDNLRIASSAAGDGLTGGGGSALSVDLKSSGGLKITGGEVEVHPSDFAGVGLEHDGSDNLRLNVHGLSTDSNAGNLSDSIAISDASDSNLTKKITINQLKTLVDNTSVIYTAGDGLTLSGQQFKQRAVLHVTVAAGVFLIDGKSKPIVTTPKTLDFYFDLSDSSLSGRVFALSTTSDGTHTGGGAQFTNGVTTGGTPGSAGAFLEVKFTQEDNDVLYYYDANTSGMGNKIITGMSYLETDSSDVTFAGKGKFPQGIEGFIQKLSDGSTDFIQAGDNIVVTNNSNGSITISSNVASAFTAGDGIDINSGVISTDLKAAGGLKITSGEVEVDDTVVPKLAGATFQGSITVPGAGGIRGSIQKLADGSTDFIQAGSNVTVTNNANGSITIASTAGGGGGGGSGTIGSAEDGDYTDGLFADFTTNTNVGTAVDRFNEVLKALAPDPAPNLTSISVTTSGATCKLSFGASNPLGTYTNVAASAGLGSAADTNTVYTSTTSSGNIRIGAVASGTTISGIVAAGVAANTFDGGVVNYPANSLGSADQGTIQLIVNGVTVRTVDLTDNSVGSGSPGSGTASVLTSGSGFVNISAIASGKFSNGSSFDVFKHRTLNFQVGSAHQRTGWNYVQVKHVIGSTEHTTNFVEWVVDETTDDTEALSASSNSLTGLSLTGTRYLSGVKYNTGGTANYAVTVSNAYKDVYSNSSITFSGTSCTVPSQSFPAVSGGQNSSKTLSITGTATINDTKMLNESMSVAVNVPHPIRNNLTSAGSSSITGILIYNITDNSTVLSENFSGETYRLRTGVYGNQSDISGASWDSEQNIVAGGSSGHVNGLMVYNNRLVSPINAINSGDFRNSSEGGNILNGPDGNVNYSSTTGAKTYFRRFTNNTGGSKNNFNLSMTKSGTTIVLSDGTLNSSNVKISVRLPQTSDNFSTAWLDIKKSFATGQVDSDGDGCLVGTFDTSNSSTNQCTFGTQSVGNNEYIVIRVTANESWTGNISQLTVAWT